MSSIYLFPVVSAESDPGLIRVLLLPVEITFIKFLETYVCLFSYTVCLRCCYHYVTCVFVNILRQYGFLKVRSELVSLLS